MSARALADVAVPTTVVVAGRDEVVPAERGRAPFEALPGPKALTVVEGAGHDDRFARVDEGWWQALRAGLDEAGGGTPRGSTRPE